MTSNAHLRRLVVAAVIAVAAFPVGAQESTPGTFGEVLEVRVINLEVVVTDKDGVRVPGLGPGDFRLRLNGKEVPLDFFTEVRGGDAIETVAGGAPGVQNVPAAVPGSPVGTSYLVFVDDFFSVARDRDRALRTLRAESVGLGAQDRMALVAFDGRRLTMLSSWSGPGPQLERAFDEATRRPSYGLQRLAERQQSDRDSRLRGRSVSAPRSLDGRLDPFELDYAERLADQVRNSIDAGAATLRAFANPPGRKVLLLLSGGWPFSPAEYATADRFRTVLEPTIPRGDELYAPLEDTANRLGYTIYGVDLPGLDAGAGGDASIETAEAAEFVGNQRFAREQEVRYALNHTARETGGKALFGAGAGILSRVVEDTRSYYWLGFNAPQKGDDQHYRVDIESTRPGLRVRSRQGFEEVSKQREVTMAVESALLFGSPPSSRPLQAVLGKPEKAGGRILRVPVALTIPADAVTFLPVGGEFHAELEIRIAAMDERGHRSSIPVVPYRVAAKRAPLPGDVMRKDTVLEIRREKQQIVVAVYDRASGNLLSATLDFVPEAR
jgi:VWFA-related protein